MYNTEVPTQEFIKIMEKCAKYQLLREYVISCGDNYIDREVLKTFLGLKGDKKNV